MTITVSKAQLKRDMNALRGLFCARPEPMDMQTILLHAGEEIQPAVRQMVADGELILMQVQDKVYYTIGLKMKPYRLT